MPLLHADFVYACSREPALNHAALGGETMKKLWRFNPITGYWVYEREVLPETANDWLKLYQTDEPNVQFKISTNKPR